MTNTRTDWFHKAKWGLFIHFIAHEKWNLDEMTPEKWNAIVDNHNSAKLALQLKELGAGYFFLTITQTNGYFCSPNSTYDKIMGIKSPEQSKCSRRDLVSDLSDELSKYGILLMVYFVSEAPTRDPEAIFAFDYNNPNCRFIEKWKDKKDIEKYLALEKDPRLKKFQTKWEAVVSEYSRRWRKKVNGWWIDGCYNYNEMYNHPEAPNYSSFAAALRAGNPDAIIAWNRAELPLPSCPEEDYTAGELFFPVNSDLIDCHGRFEQHAQFHILPGPYWDLPKYGAEGVFNITQSVVSKGGCVTWDSPFNEDGTIAEEAYELFKKISGRLANLKMTPHVQVPRVSADIKKFPGFDEDGNPYDGVVSIRMTNTCGETIKGSIFLDIPPESIPASRAVGRNGETAPDSEVELRSVRLPSYPFSLRHIRSCVLPVSVSSPLSLEKNEISYDLPFAGDSSEDIVIKNTLSGGRCSTLEIYNKNRKYQIAVPVRRTYCLPNLGKSPDLLSLREKFSRAKTFIPYDKNGISSGEIRFGYSEGKLIISVKASDEIMKYDFESPYNASCIELLAAKTRKTSRNLYQEVLTQIFIVPSDTPEITRVNAASGKCERIIGAKASLKRSGNNYELIASIPAVEIFEGLAEMPDAILLEAIVDTGKDGKYIHCSLFDSPSGNTSSDFYSEFRLKKKQD